MVGIVYWAEDAYLRLRSYIIGAMASALDVRIENRIACFILLSHALKGQHVHVYNDEVANESHVVNSFHTKSPVGFLGRSLEI